MDSLIFFILGALILLVCLCTLSVYPSSIQNLTNFSIHIRVSLSHCYIVHIVFSVTLSLVTGSVSFSLSLCVPLPPLATLTFHG